MPIGRHTLFSLLSLLLVGLWTAGAAAQERDLLYTHQPGPALQQAVAALRSLSTPPTPYAELLHEGPYFVRIAPRQYILTEDNQLQDNAILGTKPFVFVTNPQSMNGKSLLDLYLDIGYEAEDIIRWQRDQDMVAIVFRYADGITLSPERKGRLPEAWKQHVYVPTWRNVFALFQRLAREADIQPDKKGEFAPEQSFFRSRRERQFVLGFPREGKRRIMQASYPYLRAVGGADWVYRRLLEDKLSIFEHFRGNGRTHNEVVDPLGDDPEAGVLEFVGPNRKLKELPELAVIHLGTLSMEDGYPLGSATEAR